MRFSDLIQHVESKPGVYLMRSETDEYLYIGKAKDLNKRLKQYFQGKKHPHRVKVMLEQVHDLNVMITESEADALILENRLIKQHQPIFNILLKDDKSFPYLRFSEHGFPRLELTRAKGNVDSEVLFGPYTHKKEASIVLDQIQRSFLIRNCSDHFFRNRVRPCLQYEINRCSAPCVQYIDQKTYQKDVIAAEKMLKGEVGQSHVVLTKRMHGYAKEQDFEKAAACRDLLRTIATKKEGGAFEQHVFFAEKIGSSIIVVKIDRIDEATSSVYCDVIDAEGKYLEEDWISQYVYQYYQTFSKPSQVLLPIANKRLLEKALGSVTVKDLCHQSYQHLVKLAKENIQAHLQSKSSELFQWPIFWQQLEHYLQRPISKIVCLDVSHNQGSCTYAALVQCGVDGMVKKQYRSYKTNTGGDDYLAMQQALTKALSSKRIDEDTLVLIDGGKGQLSSAAVVLEALGCPLTSIAKGPARTWGKETFYRYDNGVHAFKWPAEMIKYVLHIRDEAHHFSVKLHRRALRKLTLQSVLDQIPGIGPEKKSQILRYFGGLEQLQCAKLEELVRVPGVGEALAKKIYQTLQGG